jgi:hypothetical protein
MIVLENICNVETHPPDRFRAGARRKISEQAGAHSSQQQMPVRLCTISRLVICSAYQLDGDNGTETPMRVADARFDQIALIVVNTGSSFLPQKRAENR